MLSGFLGIILVIMPTDNNSPHKVRETEATKITATVDVVIPSGSILTNHHDQICVGDGSDKWVADYVNICISVSKNVSVNDFNMVCPFNLCLHNCLHICLGTLFT